MRQKECAALDGSRHTPPRAHDGRRTRENILAAAQAIFAEKGFAAANVNEIVAHARTTKPMIYYHFGSKEGLFAAVLEEVYAGMREAERAVQTDGMTAAEAMRALVRTTFTYHAAHPDWIRLISVANIHDAAQIRQSPTIASRNAAVVGIVGELLERGAREGIFRAGVDPLHLHLLIASFCFYRVSNRHTWKVIFGRDLGAPDEAAAQCEMVADAVLRYLAPTAA